MQVSLIGIDLAKRYFQVCALNQQNRVLFNRQVTRAKLPETLQQIAPTTVAMESCATANYWGRKFTEMGHEVQLVPPQHVKAFLRAHKSDARDALAICEASRRPELHFVPLKTQAQQDLQVLMRYRHKLVANRTGCVNQIRAFAAENGLVFPVGIRSIRRHLHGVIIDTELPCSETVRYVLMNLHEQLTQLDESDRAAMKQIELLLDQNPAAQRLRQIPGFGILVTAAFIASIGDGKHFNNGRQCAASIGLVPRQTGTGGKTQLLGITKHGNRHLRTMLVHGARAVITWRQKRDDGMSRWANQLIERRGYQKALIALANKMARIGWSVVAKGQDFDLNKAFRK